MNVRYLEYFLAAERRGSLSAAASDLHVTQSAMSQGIAALEATVQARLLDRSSAGVRLTDAGRALKPYAVEALGVVARGRVAVTKAGRMEGGSLEIACPTALGIDPLVRLVARFRDKFPEVDIHVRDLPEQSIDERTLFDLDVDVALTFRDLVDPDLDAVDLAPLELVAVIPEPSESPVTLQQILQRGLVTTAATTAPRLHLSTVFDAETIERSIAVEVIHPDAVIPLVLNGAGATLIAQGHAVSAVSVEGLAVCTIDPPALLDVVAVVPRASRSVAALQFVRICQEMAATA